MKLEVLVG